MSVFTNTLKKDNLLPLRLLVKILLCLLLTHNICAQEKNSDNLQGLQADILLHPGEAFTAYTYKKGTFFYAQNLVPYPGFAQIGITNWLTVELPFWEWFGQVVSLNLRFRLLKQNGFLPALAYETQYQYLPREVDLLEGNSELSVIRKGHNWYHRINASWRLTPTLMLHLSGGATYSEYLSFANKDSSNLITDTYSQDISPDLSLGLDWRAYPWLSLHTSISQGTTYMYIDNTARKQQFTLGTRLAPFYRARAGFLRAFRVELVVFTMKFGQVPNRLTSPYGFIYWQWHWQKKKRD